jgi:hypothetical protein
MAINVYEPLKFSTQGINDLATQTSLTVTNGRIAVDYVQPIKALEFAGNSLGELSGMGIRWTDGRRSKTLSLKQDSLFSDLSINLAEEQEYQINDVKVLSFTSLGPTVTSSNLKTLGTLKTLNVAGNTALGNVLFVNSDNNQIGINTDSPKGAIGVVENGVEIKIGSSKTDTASIGTVSNDHLEIVTDNTPRIVVSNNGDVQVFGKLIVDDFVIQKSTTVAFKETALSSNYGMGMVWSNLNRHNAQLIYHADPDRIWSTESIDLAQDKCFSINNVSVLDQTTLGSTVLHSSLTKVGVLTDLQVAGDAAVTRSLHAGKINVGMLVLDQDNIKTDNTINIIRRNRNEISIDDNIVIGNSSNTDRTVSLYGQVTVGVANPDPGVALTVAGPVSIENKKFQVGESVPTSGSFSKGDIVWNANPMPHNFIGWVCIVDGTPGQWLPFGAIVAQ